MFQLSLESCLEMTFCGQTAADGSSPLDQHQQNLALQTWFAAMQDFTFINSFIMVLHIGQCSETYFSYSASTDVTCQKMLHLIKLYVSYTHDIHSNK